MFEVTFLSFTGSFSEMLNPLTYLKFKLRAVWLPVKHVHSLPVRKVLFCLVLHVRDQCTATEVGQFLVRLLQETLTAGCTFY